MVQANIPAQRVRRAIQNAAIEVYDHDVMAGLRKILDDADPDHAGADYAYPLQIHKASHPAQYHPQ
jgi:hypothetical protein